MGQALSRLLQQWSSSRTDSDEISTDQEVTIPEHGSGSDGAPITESPRPTGLAKLLEMQQGSSSRTDSDEISTDQEVTIPSSPPLTGLAKLLAMQEGSSPRLAGLAELLAKADLQMSPIPNVRSTEKQTKAPLLSPDQQMSPSPSVLSQMSDVDVKEPASSAFEVSTPSPSTSKHPPTLVKRKNDEDDFQHTKKPKMANTSEIPPMELGGQIPYGDLVDDFVKRLKEEFSDIPEYVFMRTFKFILEEAFETTNVKCPFCPLTCATDIILEKHMKQFHPKELNELIEKHKLF